MALQRKLQQCPAVSPPPTCCCSPQQAFRRGHKRSSAVQWRVGSTLKSLDNILGSQDDQDATRPEAPEQKQQVSSGCLALRDCATCDPHTPMLEPHSNIIS
jgi:hypothetical protein